MWVGFRLQISVSTRAQNTLTATLQRGKTLPQWVSLVWHKIILWWGSSNAGATPSFPLLPGPLWPRVVASDRVLSMGQIELKCVFMLNWITWNRTVYLDWPWVVASDRVLSMGQIELKCVFMLNWITWNRTVYLDLTLKNLQWLICHKTQMTNDNLLTHTHTHTHTLWGWHLLVCSEQEDVEEFLWTQ